jgi:hypothetical protein
MAPVMPAIEDAFMAWRLAITRNFIHELETRVLKGPTGPFKMKQSDEFTSDYRANFDTKHIKRVSRFTNPKSGSKEFMNSFLLQQICLRK